jgi:hypothetical protein
MFAPILPSPTMPMCNVIAIVVTVAMSKARCYTRVASRAMPQR